MPAWVWKTHSSTTQDVAGNTLSDVDGSTSKYCHSTQPLNKGWDGGNRIFFCPSHPCWPSSVDQLPHKACSWNDLTEEPGSGRPHPLMDTAKEGALLWHLAVESGAWPAVWKKRGGCSPLLPLVPEGHPGRCYLSSSIREQWQQGRSSSEIRTDDTGSAEPQWRLYCISSLWPHLQRDCSPRHVSRKLVHQQCVFQAGNPHCSGPSSTYHRVTAAALMSRSDLLPWAECPVSPHSNSVLLSHAAL